MDPATGSGWEFSKLLERDKLSEISVPFKGLWWVGHRNNLCYECNFPTHKGFSYFRNEHFIELIMVAELFAKYKYNADF